MDIRLNGKNALVCGSTQGIGKAAALELARLGANVTLFARNKDRLEQTHLLLDKSGEQHHHVLVADFDDNDQVASAVSDHHDFHILVNNTGGPPAGRAIEANQEEYIAAFNNHLLNNQLITRALVPFMEMEKYGRIINIISTSVKIPIRGLGVSNTIRGAVANWAKTLAGELAPLGITVNNVLPGATDTTRLRNLISNKAAKLAIPPEKIEKDMISEIPLGRFASPEEVGGVIAFLATPAASYVNGVNVPVDGGRTGSL